MLGFRISEALTRTGDLDIAQFHSVSNAVGDEIDGDFLTMLRRVDSRFEAIPSVSDTRRSWRYAIRAGTRRPSQWSFWRLCGARRDLEV